MAVAEYVGSTVSMTWRMRESGWPPWSAPALFVWLCLLNQLLTRLIARPVSCL